MRLQGKVAMVTGGASGIGEATCVDMVQEGAWVAILDVHQDKGEALARRLSAERQDAARAYALDVRDEGAVAAVVGAVERDFRRIDILFNNAGVGGMTAVTDLDVEEWSRVLDINLRGYFLMTKHTVPAMRRTGGGSIVNCASILGSVGMAMTASYSAAKGGVVNLTRTLASELAQDRIRVNTVSPGFVNTPLLDELDEPTKAALTAMHALGRFAEPEEIAKCVTFLASEDASFVTGANLLVDGGYTAV